MVAVCIRSLFWNPKPQKYIIPPSKQHFHNSPINNIWKKFQSPYYSHYPQLFGAREYIWSNFLGINFCKISMLFSRIQINSYFCNTVSLIHVFITCLDPVWRYIIAGHYHGYRFWRPVDAQDIFYSRLGLQKVKLFTLLKLYFFFCH